MRLTAYLLITPKKWEAGKEPGSAGWEIGGAVASLPAGLAPLTKVAKLTIEISDSEFDLAEIKVKWPDGELDPEVVAELKNWTDNNP